MLSTAIYNNNNCKLQLRAEILLTAFIYNPFLAHKEGDMKCLPSILIHCQANTSDKNN